MGACSSKPKTTEFEGSTEPTKETEAVAADRGIESVDTAQVSEPKESAKQEVGAADVKTEALQPTSLPVESKEVEPLVSGLSSTEEGVSHNKKSETDAIEGEARYETAESGGKVDTGISQKDDEGAGVADIADVSDKGTTVDGRVRGAQDKDLEDKAVVLDEAGAGIGDAYVDKGVAADDEKGQDIGTATPADEQLKTLQGISEPPGVDSPIIGVVQPADPVRVEDVSESMGLPTLGTPAPADSTAREPPSPADSTGREAPVEIDKDGSTGASTGENGIAITEAANLSPGLPQETSAENEVDLHEDPKGSPVEASVSDDGVVQEGAADDTGHEGELPASAQAQDVKDTIELEKVEDPQNHVDERTVEPQEENPFEENAKESHARVPETEDNAEVVDEPKPEALNTAKAADVETSIEPKSGTALEEPVVKNDTQPQTLAVEEPVEDGKQPEASPDAGVPEPHGKIEQEEKAEEPHIEEAATSKEFVERVDAGKPELPVEHEKNGVGEGDLSFEDASDVPLKVEASHVEPEDAHSS